MLRHCWYASLFFVIFFQVKKIKVLTSHFWLVCFVILGFIKFLGPYYMLLITKRKKMGVICGHAIYAITKSEILAIPNSTIASNMDCSKNENRSFVNSACKCEMYLVFFRKHKTFRSQNLVVDHCIMIGLFPFTLFCFLLITYYLILIFCIAFSLFPNLDWYFNSFTFQPSVAYNSRAIY